MTLTPVADRSAALSMLAPLALALCAGGTIAQPSFRGLGDFSGGAFSSDAWRISSDGMALAAAGTLVDGGVAARWTEMDGLVRLGRLPGLTDLSFSTAISGTGKYVVGYSEGAGVSEAFLWSADAGMISLGDLPGGAHASRAYNISADGTTVVGRGDMVDNWPTLTGQAFLWTEATGMIALGYSQPHHDDSEAWAVSKDGSVVTGLSFKNFSDGEAFIWTQGSGMVGLGDIAGGPDNFSAAVDMNSDGSVIVGVCSPPGGYEAFRWTQGTGMVPLGDLPGGEHYSDAFGVSEDGNTIVGIANWDGGNGDERAYIWTHTQGMRDLKAVLETDYGIDLTGWTLLAANDLSADGKIIVGQGINPAGDREAWIADLHKAPCPGDFNGDGTRNTLDVLVFLNAWNAGCP